MSNVDREKDCPFLLRIFTRKGAHNQLSAYTVNEVPQDELAIYTWKNATLEEIAQLIEQVVPDARDPDARISFRLVYLDQHRGKYFARDIGRVVSAKPTKEQKKTLEECKFVIGDYLDVAVFIGPPPSVMRDQRSRGRDFGRFSSGRPPRRSFDRGYNNNNNNNNRFGGRPRRDY
ncbi:hypothetical protein CU097_005295 [Rhizopus azygosporus]|uniref:Histone deacetylase complex subunit sap18 n=1 Tax=Rhizopus azygosporus TaxID=86630 RepID=A0A367JD45_RHIAZ|nr:hypothetical protein CU097_005295 [Rhizopus azygosporus]